ARDNLVGGQTILARNLISGNSGPGIEIRDPGTAGNRVEGNFIGSDGAGTVPLGNNLGVQIALGATDNRIGSPAAGNLISGNRKSGVAIQDAGTTGNQIQGNYIGTNANGSAALVPGVGFSQDAGVAITDASDNLVGGAEPGAGNLISGNP